MLFSDKIIKFIFLSCMILSCYFQSFANNQNPKIDSLEKLLHIIKDEKKAEVNTTLAMQYLSVSPKKSIAIIKKSLEYLEKHQNSHQKARAYYCLGWAHEEINNFNESLQHYKYSLEIAKEINHNESIINALNSIGIVYYQIKLYDKSLEYYFRYLEKVIENKDSLHIFGCYNNISQVYYSKKNYDKAEEYLIKIMASFKDEFSYLNTHVLSNMGEINYKKKNYKKSLFYYKKALSVLEKRNEYGEHDLFVIVHNGIGACYSILNNKKEALAEFEKSLIYSENSIDFQSKTMIYKSIYILTKNDDPERAYDALEQYSFYSDSLKNKIHQNELKQQRIRLLVEEENHILTKQKELNDLKINRQKVIIWFSLLLLFVLVWVFLLQITKIKLKKNLAETNEQKSKEKNQRLEAEKQLEIHDNLRLKENIKHKEKELTTISMYISQKGELLEKINNQLKDVSDTSRNPEVKNEIKKINRMIKENVNLDNEWEFFILHFNKSHPGFIDKLKVTYPILTKNDIRFCVYVRIGMSNKEMAQHLNVAVTTIKVNRMRLRKKLGLYQNESVTLTDFIREFK